MCHFAALRNDNNGFFLSNVEQFIAFQLIDMIALFIKFSNRSKQRQNN